MNRHRIVVRAMVLAVIAVVLASRQVLADDAWVEVTSPNFTVVSNAGEKKARNVAWQFEQVRAAIGKGWPWARVTLNMPVMVIAVKDEGSMKAIAPYYWEQHHEIHPASIFNTGLDRHYIALRTDVEAENREGVNPYQQSYWSYASLALETSFNRGLPLWFVTGMASVLSNSLISSSDIQFGRPIPYLAREMSEGPRLRLNDLLAVTRQSPYYTQGATRNRYDAQCWILMQYVLFGGADPRTADQANELARLLLLGTPAEAAVTKVYGSLDALENGYLLLLKNGMYKYARMHVDSDTTAQKYPARPLAKAESSVELAGFHVSMGRLTEARALLTEARTADAKLARLYEVEGEALDRERNAADAQQAYDKAAALDSKNFFIHMRLAAAAFRPNADPATLANVQKLLAKSIELNDSYAPALALLATTMMLQNQPDAALGPAQRALALEPAQFSNRLIAARVLLQLSRFDEARTAAQAALASAHTDQERALAQATLDAASSSTVPAAPRTIKAEPSPERGVVGGVAGGVVGGVVGGVQSPQTPAPPPPPPPPAGAVRVGGAIKPPKRLTGVNPVYPVIAQSARVQGVVIIEAIISPTGTVSDARVLRSVPLLDQAAVDAVKQWVYEPTLLNGVAVPVIMTVTVNFALQESFTLRVTDTKGAVVFVKDPEIDYADPPSPAAPSPVRPPTTSGGIRVYQGEGQTIVKWSTIDSITFKSDKSDAARNAKRLDGELVLSTGQHVPTQFVVPAKGGGLKGKTDLGAYVIALSDIAQIVRMPDHK